MFQPVSYSRAERVAEVLKRELSEILQRKVKDPRLKRCVVSRVTMSNDLCVARVWLSMFPHDMWPQTQEALGRASGYLRREVSRRMDLRRSPELRFELDHAAEHLIEMDQLLRGLGTEPEKEEDVSDTPNQNDR